MSVSGRAKKKACNPADGEDRHDHDLRRRAGWHGMGHEDGGDIALHESMSVKRW